MDHARKTKLPEDMLYKVMELGDVDQDGYLDFGEFICASHIAYVCRDVRVRRER